MMLDPFKCLQWGLQVIEFPERNSWCWYFKPIQVCSRSCHQRCSVKKGVLRNFTEFTGKHLCQRLFQALACNFIKRESLAQVFSVNFVKFLRTLFYRTPLGDCFWCFLKYGWIRWLSRRILEIKFLDKF